jgi:hypothetical protein
MSFPKLSIVRYGVAIWLLAGVSRTAAADTNAFLNAPVVKAELAVRWNKEVLQWKADNQPAFRAFPTDALFLTRRSIYVTYPSLNPLRLQATASVTAVADPSFDVMTKLITAITSVVTTVTPPAASPNAKSDANTKSLVARVRTMSTGCVSAQDDIDALFLWLYGKESTPGEIKKTVDSWAAAIDTSFAAGHSGSTAIGDGVAPIRDFAASFFDPDTGIVTQGKKALDHIKSCSVIATGEQKTPYELAVLTNQDLRIQQLTAVGTAATNLADLLDQQFRPAEKWMGDRSTDYIISDEIIPTFQKMQNVAVTTKTVTLNVDSTTGAITVKQQAGDPTTFTVRKYSPLVPEIGAGAVFGSIKAPSYATSKNAAGQTIVVQVSDSSISVNPGLMVNWVCRCGAGLLAPMFQIGASTSKDLPAILSGVGIRLFGLGKGDVSISGGAMFAWYKDLQKLHVNDIISGTNDIAADLGYSSRPKVGRYFAILYKF